MSVRIAHQHKAWGVTPRYEHQLITQPAKPAIEIFECADLSALSEAEGFVMESFDPFQLAGLTLVRNTTQGSGWMIQILSTRRRSIQSGAPRMKLRGITKVRSRRVGVSLTLFLERT